MKVIATGIPGLLIVEPQVYRDARGTFMETYHARRYAEAGIRDTFVQDNVSLSHRGVLRGLHAQSPHAQGKLVGCLHGEVFDVAVDIRAESPTFARWEGVLLSGENGRQLYVPPGFAHGFLTLSDTALLTYKVTDYYDPQGEFTVRWNDPSLGIKWPLHGQPPLMSPKDEHAPLLSETDSAKFLPPEAV